VSRVVLLDPAGGLEAVASGLGGPPDIELDRAAELPSGAGVVAVLVPPEVPVGAAEVARLPDLRLVAATSTGFDHLDLEAISAAGAWATHCAGYCDEEVADHAIAFALDLLRGVTLLDDSVRAGSWELEPVLPRRIAGSTLGIVGLGRIGGAVAARGVGLGMTVIAHDPFATSDSVQLVDLDELLARADVVTLHPLLTPATRGMIDAPALRLMRPGSYLVNCARAALVDQGALAEALRSGHLGGCALDVLPNEPPGPDEPALSWPRTIINPHAAWYSADSADEPYRRAGEAAAAVLAGREPRDVLARPKAPGPAERPAAVASPPDR
jgi:D-3-phosphoglycerate dehydrogenase